MDGALAGWTDNGWRFVVPGEGWRAWVADRGQAMRFDGAAWSDEEARAGGYFVAGDRVLAGRQRLLRNPAAARSPITKALRRFWQFLRTAHPWPDCNITFIWLTL